MLHASSSLPAACHTATDQCQVTINSTLYYTAWTPKCNEKANLDTLLSLVSTKNVQFPEMAGVRHDCDETSMN